MRDAFSQLEYTGWRRVAGLYDSVWSGLTRHFIGPLVDAIELVPGVRLLDVACGPGYVAEMAREAGAAPIGLDFSVEMVRLASTRNPGIAFTCGDALALPFRNGAFDALSMNFGLLHLPDPEAALVEARRVLRVGGRCGFTVWASPEQSPGARIVEEAIRAHADLRVDLPAGPDYFVYGDADECRKALGKSGFDPCSVRFRTITASWQVPSASFVFVAERDAGVRTAALLAAQSPSTWRAIEMQMTAAFEPFRNATGFGIPYAAHVISVVAA